MTPSILVTLLLVTGPYSVSTGELRQILATSTQHYAEAGIKLRVNKIYKLRDRHENLESISESRQKFYLYRSLVRRAGYDRKGRVHIVLPPMREPGGVRYIGGFGESGCNPRGVSVSNGQAVRSNGLEGLTPSSIALSHEVAHTVNAKHEGGINLMNPAALQYWDRPVGFSQSTVNRMRRCLK